jgi:hypothetical protein
MKYDVRSACLTLIRRHTDGSTPRRAPRPLALGWKLESGMVPDAELNALCESLRGAAPALRCWVTSGPLRALLIEYRAVRRAEARCRKPKRARRGPRPADCA